MIQLLFKAKNFHGSAKDAAENPGEVLAGLGEGFVMPLVISATTVLGGFLLANVVLAFFFEARIFDVGAVFFGILLIGLYVFLFTVRRKVSKVVNTFAEEGKNRVAKTIDINSSEKL